MPPERKHLLVMRALWLKWKISLKESFCNGQKEGHEVTLGEKMGYVPIFPLREPPGISSDLSENFFRS